MQINPFDITTVAIYFAVPIVIILVVMGRDLSSAISTVMLGIAVTSVLDVAFLFYTIS